MTRPDIVLVGLCATATLVAVLARWLRLPYTVLLVLAGLALGATRWITPPHLTRELLYAVFLPGLLFEAAYQLGFRHYARNKLAITGLAVPGVIASIALTTAMLAPAVRGLHGVAGFTAMHAMLLAATLAATDPIAVVALFRSLGAPARLAHLVEGESLLNDGTGIVLFTLILGIATGGDGSIVTACIAFVRVVGLGALVGACIGYAARRSIGRTQDPSIAMSLTTLAAYGSFVAAEHLGASGVMATVVAGMSCGHETDRPGATSDLRSTVTSYWQFVAFVLESTVFLLLGSGIRFSALWAAWPAILVAYGTVVVARAIVVTATALLLRPTRERIPASWAVVVGWGGLRGALSIVLALSVPTTFAGRDTLITMTSGVVLLSIVVQGLTMRPLIARLGLAQPPPTVASDGAARS